MFNSRITLKYIATLIIFLSIWVSDCYSNYRKAHSHYNTCLRDSSEVPKKIIPVDEEILKKLQERHRDEIYKYLEPLQSHPVEQVSEKELEETFGKPLTQKNIQERSKSARKVDPMDLPDVEPSNKLPYFVNLEFVPESHTHLGTADQQNTNVDTDHEYNDTIDANYDQKTVDNTINTDLDSTGKVDEACKDSESGADPKTLKCSFKSDIPLDYTSTDPLKPLFDKIEGYPEVEEKYGPKWYLPNLKSELRQEEYEDGWSILPCGKVYKRVLRPSLFAEKHKVKPTDSSCLTFKFKILEAKTNNKIVETEDAGGPMVTTYMKELGPVMQRCLKSMNNGEQAEFVFHISELNPENMIVDELAGVSWVRLWINLWDSNDTKERWWSLGPGDAHLYPSRTDSDENKLETLDKQTDEITSQIESELATNPSSPLWADVLDKMTSSQKESYVKHFDRQLEKVERMKHCEYTGSRGFGDAIKSSGQLGGYDLGQQSGGVSKFISWRETPFMMYVAIAVIPGVRAEHVKLDLTSRHLVLSIGNNVIIDDDLMGSVDLDTTGVWAMSDASLEHTPLDRADPRLKSPTLDLDRMDEYDEVTRRPSVLIFFKKSGTSVTIWGYPFANT